MKNKKLADTQ